jgi:hypothetical protein
MRDRSFPWGMFCWVVINFLMFPWKEVTPILAITTISCPNVCPSASTPNYLSSVNLFTLVLMLHLQYCHRNRLFISHVWLKKKFFSMLLVSRLFISLRLELYSMKDVYSFDCHMCLDFFPSSLCIDTKCEVVARVDSISWRGQSVFLFFQYAVYFRCAVM